MYPTHPPTTVIWLNDTKTDLNVDMYLHGKMVHFTLPYSDFEVVSNIQDPNWKNRPRVNPDENGMF